MTSREKMHKLTKLLAERMATTDRDKQKAIDKEIEDTKRVVTEG